MNDVMMMNPNYEVIDFNEFDILLTDIRGETIRTLELDGCKHHSEFEKYNQSSAPSVLTGVTYGDYQRVLVKAVIVYRKALNVIMIVDTGSPYTFLTEETLKALGVQVEDQPKLVASLNRSDKPDTTRLLSHS